MKTIKKQLQNGENVWFTLAEMYEYSQETDLLEHNGKYLCYFKYSPPNEIIYGELFRNNDHKPLVFKSKERTLDFIEEIIINTPKKIMNKKPKFKIDDYVKHVQTREVYKVIEVIKGAYQFFYRLETDEDIIIETPYPESVLEIIENNLEIND